MMENVKPARFHYETSLTTVKEKTSVPNPVVIASSLNDTSSNTQIKEDTSCNEPQWLTDLKWGLPFDWLTVDKETKKIAYFFQCFKKRFQDTVTVEELRIVKTYLELRSFYALNVKKHRCGQKGQMACDKAYYAHSYFYQDNVGIFLKTEFQAHEKRHLCLKLR